jgi:hypothetical protein
MPELPDAIGAKIDAGTLPRERSEKLFAGHGEGELCSACETPIHASQVEWSIREQDRVTVRFHLGCHSLWDEQLRKRTLVQSLVRPPRETVAYHLRRYPRGLCLTCLADLSMLLPSTVTAVIADLEHTITVLALQGTCGRCGEARRLIHL